MTKVHLLLCSNVTCPTAAHVRELLSLYQKRVEWGDLIWLKSSKVLGSEQLQAFQFVFICGDRENDIQPLVPYGRDWILPDTFHAYARPRMAWNSKLRYVWLRAEDIWESDGKWKWKWQTSSKGNGNILTVSWTRDKKDFHLFIPIPPSSGVKAVLQWFMAQNWCLVETHPVDVSQFFFAEHGRFLC